MVMKTTKQPEQPKPEPLAPAPVQLPAPSHVPHVSPTGVLKIASPAIRAGD